MVVCYHYLPKLPPIFGQAVIARGFMAVNFFFILSGFVLAYNYADLTPGSDKARRFWVARFWRIYPIYLLALILSTPISLNAMRLGLIEYSIPRWIAGGALSAICLQAWVPEAARSWNFPGWSISCEAFFYAVFPWLVARFRRESLARKRKLFGALCVLSLVGPSALFALKAAGIHSGSRGWESPASVEDLFVLHFPIFHLPSFAMGVIAGLIFPKRRHFTDSAAITCIFASLAAIILVSLSPLPNEFVQNGVLAPAFTLLIYALAAKSSPTRVLANRWMKGLGEASYAIYILQVPIFCSTAANFRLLGGDVDKFAVRYFVISFVILIAGSLVATRVAKKTFHGRIARWSSSGAHVIETTGS